MSGPRNKPAAARGAAIRERIRCILAKHPPLAFPLTASQVQALLDPEWVLKLRTVQEHMQAVRNDAISRAARNS